MSRNGAAIPLDDAGVKTAEEMAYDTLHPERERAPGNSGQAIPLGDYGRYDPPMVKARVKLGHFVLWHGRRARVTRFADDGVRVHIMIVGAPETDAGIDVALDTLSPDDNDSFSLDGELFATDADGNRKVFREGDSVRLRTGETGRVSKVSSSHVLVVSGEGSGVECTTICALADVAPVVPAAAARKASGLAIPL